MNKKYKTLAFIARVGLRLTKKKKKNASQVLAYVISLQQCLLTALLKGYNIG